MVAFMPNVNWSWRSWELVGELREGLTLVLAMQEVLV